MITYLFGAGASVNALPLGAGLSESMNELAKKLEKYDDEKVKILINDLFWLADKAKEYGTVDSFAKNLKMHVVDRNTVFNYDNLFNKIDKKGEYRRLKNTLNAFFIISQNKNLDLRYNRFLSHILIKEDNSIYSVKDNVKILSWNYDNQLEIAFSKNYENSRMKDVHAMIASFPAPFLLGDKYYHHGNDNFDVNNYKVSVIHLNGVAGLYDMNEGYDIVDIINSKSVDDTIFSATKVYNSINSYLNFSWDNENEKTINLAIKKTEETEILVIIGYSLPLFNKDIDRKILSSYSKLKKIYIQNIRGHETENEVKLQLKNRGINPNVEIAFDYNTDYFKVPDELE